MVTKNEWFGKDRIMTAAALALDAELKEQGFDPSDPEFYNEIDNRIKKHFLINSDVTQEFGAGTTVKTCSSGSWSVTFHSSPNIK